MCWLLIFRLFLIMSVFKSQQTKFDPARRGEQQQRGVGLLFFLSSFFLFVSPIVTEGTAAAVRRFSSLPRPTPA
jgi:hypothetical protein